MPCIFFLRFLRTQPSHTTIGVDEASFAVAELGGAFTTSCGATTIEGLIVLGNIGNERKCTRGYFG